MKKFVLGLMVVAVAGMTVTSCKKYDEGPGFSLKSKKGRLSGEWEVEKYITSGGTETQDNASTVITYEKDGTYKYANTAGSFTGTWKFDDKKENLITEFSYQFGGQTITNQDTVTILRLTNKEFWTVDEDNDKTYLKAKE